MDEKYLNQIQKEQKQAISASNSAYDTMQKNNDALYKQQQNYANQYETTQNSNLDKQLALQENRINQQKEIANQNRAAEARRALNDYDAINNQYGNTMENLRNQGLSGAGVSSNVAIASNLAYQNRLSTANKVLQDALLEYDTQMNEARANNDIQKAQNALTKLQLQTDYLTNYYTNKNNYTHQQLTTNQNLNSDYWNRYTNELQRQDQNSQWQKSFDENKRQYDTNLEYQKGRDSIADNQWTQSFNENKRQYDTNLAYQKDRDAVSDNQWLQTFNENQRQYNTNLDYQKSRDAVSDDQWAKEYALSQSTANARYGSGSGGNYEKLEEENTKPITKNDPIAIPSIVLNAIKRFTSKDAQRNTLSVLYRNGKITEDTLKSVCEKLGL